MLSTLGLCARKRPRPVESFQDGCSSKSRSSSSSKNVKFGDIRLYFVEKKMGRSRRSFLSQLATSKGFIVEEMLSDEVTHVIAEDNDAASLWAWLKGRGLNSLPMMHVVDISWFTESMKDGRPVAMETRHLIQDTGVKTCPGPSPESTVSQYACQRRTTTENKNTIFTDALEVLVEHYELSEMEGPCVSFRRAVSVLKSLSWSVESVRSTEGLPSVGDTIRNLIEEILQYGRSFEVEKILADEKYQTLKLFTSVFGVGPKTAHKWYRQGLRSLSQILAHPHIQLNRMQQNGFLHYSDLSRGMRADEARAVEALIGETVWSVAPNALVTLTGGFRRGKEFGHDVDFIVTTAEAGGESLLLPLIMERLQEQGLLLFQDYRPSTFDLEKIPCRRFEAMDYYAKCFLILKLEGSRVQGGVEGDRGWRAVRVDLVCPPTERFAFTQLGWTGSRQFERDLRRFARIERNMILDNHALYDKTKNQFLAALTEKDIFAHLGLEYMEPWHRNA
ncbi:DNA nucleotidylexotransferase isoform X2 [Boleophthalmus pectinirostris]|uniref:DNA nucleotidylexotransferase isoform X2 n=1 Tax=Boleophthalmus pectinirostris TaxID=150288 RepID=UPI0024330FCE|nr:DNA nucleotidylexotransferase isoform X2 [Boleophthalmus pectinirostris]